MIGDPAANASTIPVALPTDANDGLLLDQVPPDVELDSVVALPAQTDMVPVFAAKGFVLTVSGNVVVQPVFE
jgi:hypothetical protein